MMEEKRKITKKLHESPLQPSDSQCCFRKQLARVHTGRCVHTHGRDENKANLDTLSLSSFSSSIRIREKTEYFCCIVCKFSLLYKKNHNSQLFTERLLFVKETMAFFMMTKDKLDDLRNKEQQSSTESSSDKERRNTSVDNVGSSGGGGSSSHPDRRTSWQQEQQPYATSQQQFAGSGVVDNSAADRRSAGSGQSGWRSDGIEHGNGP